jgi:hypothetical protein
MHLQWLLPRSSLIEPVRVMRWGKSDSSCRSFKVTWSFNYDAEINHVIYPSNHRELTTEHMMLRRRSIFKSDILLMNVWTIRHPLIDNSLIDDINFTAGICSCGGFTWLTLSLASTDMWGACFGDNVARIQILVYQSSSVIKPSTCFNIYFHKRTRTSRYSGCMKVLAVFSQVLCKFFISMNSYDYV